MTAPKKFSCKCSDGYVGNGKVCDEVDLCDSASPCSPNAQCTKTGPGKASCTCNDGYDGDGTTCAEIDACAVSPCSSHSTCKKLAPGKRTCVCATGYYSSPSGNKCLEVDNCAADVNPCGNFARCTKTGPGVNKCDCDDGYVKSPDGSCKAVPTPAPKTAPASTAAGGSTGASVGIDNIAEANTKLAALQNQLVALRSKDLGNALANDGTQDSRVLFMNKKVATLEQSTQQLLDQAAQETEMLKQLLPSGAV